MLCWVSPAYSLEALYMKKDQVELIFKKIIEIYVDKSFCEAVRRRNCNYESLKSAFTDRILASWSNFFKDKENTAFLINKLISIPWPEFSIKEDVDDFEVFVVATLLSRIAILSQTDCVERAHVEKYISEGWIVTYANQLENYWKIRKENFAQYKEYVAKISKDLPELKKNLNSNEIKKLESNLKFYQSFYPFIISLPLYHPLLLSYVERLEKDYLTQHIKFKSAVPMVTKTYMRPVEISQSKIFMQPAPGQLELQNLRPLSREEDFAARLSESMDFMQNNNVRIVFVLGDVNAFCSDVFVFPGPFIEKDFHAEDFFNYFGAEQNEDSRDRSYTAGHPKITFDKNGKGIYQIGQTFIVSTQELPNARYPKNQSPLSCDLKSHFLEIKRVQSKFLPHKLVAQHFKVYDANPIDFTDEQLKAFIDNFVKAKIENFAVAIHCRAGIGRTGMLAYIAARMFCPEMPVEVKDAVEWLRKIRPGAISTTEQLIYAEKAWQRIKVMLRLYHKDGAYNWQEYYNQNKLFEYLPVITDEKQTATKVAVEAMNAVKGPLNSTVKSEDGQLPFDAHPKELRPSIPKLGP